MKLKRVVEASIVIVGIALFTGCSTGKTPSPFSQARQEQGAAPGASQPVAQKEEDPIRAFEQELAQMDNVVRWEEIGEGNYEKVGLSEVLQIKDPGTGAQTTVNLALDEKDHGTFSEKLSDKPLTYQSDLEIQVPNRIVSSGDQQITTRGMTDYVLSVSKKPELAEGLWKAEAKSGNGEAYPIFGIFKSRNIRTVPGRSEADARAYYYASGADFKDAASDLVGWVTADQDEGHVILTLNLRYVYRHDVEDGVNTLSARYRSVSRQ